MLYHINFFVKHVNKIHATPFQLLTTYTQLMNVNINGGFQFATWTLRPLQSFYNFNMCIWEIN